MQATASEKNACILTWPQKRKQTRYFLVWWRLQNSHGRSKISFEINFHPVLVHRLFRSIQCTILDLLFKRNEKWVCKRRTSQQCKWGQYADSQKVMGRCIEKLQSVLRIDHNSIRVLAQSESHKIEQKVRIHEEISTCTLNCRPCDQCPTAKEWHCCN